LRSKNTSKFIEEEKENNISEAMNKMNKAGRHIDSNSQART
jgi:hypothetical protein